MQIVADLHIHSKYSRATSPKMSPEILAGAAKVKGVGLLGTGDFTHPKYLQELKQALGTPEKGIFTYKDMQFMLTTELSCIYTKNGKGRRVHQVIFAPDFEVVDQICDELLKCGRLDYDGRPIFGLSAETIVEMMMGISKDCLVFPAHIWTPWFSVFGSRSGFDTIEECYGDQLKHIHAIETGLSSDPAMNWRVSQLDDYSILSFSDSHSPWPWRLGREATVFDCGMSYFEIIGSIRKKENIEYTIEVDPAYGKYHWDGHRKCNVRLSPAKSKELGGMCPECGKPMTIGVDYRVEELADRPEGFVPKNAVPFKRLLPVSEVISNLYGTGLSSKKVQRESDKLLVLGSELDVLLNIPADKLLEVVDRKAVNALMKNRDGNVKMIPGYDGVYGVPVFEGDAPDEKEYKPKVKQKRLGEF